jgi:hypothetical protein
MRRKVSAGFFLVTGFLACPCHLVITLPLAAAILSGTALGGWIATHQGAIVVGASLYFVGALVVGGMLLLARRAAEEPPSGMLRPTGGGAACCPPAPPPTARPRPHRVSAPADAPTPGAVRP